MATQSEVHESGSLWTNPKRILGTTNARDLGKLYFVVSLINAAIGGLYAMFIRMELWDPEPSFFDDANAYNQAFTLHGTGMIFLVVVPLGAGWGNYLIPRMVAADNDDMYWPKINNLAFWLTIPGSAMIWLSQAQGGWTAYPPLSVFTFGIDMWILGLVLIGTSSTIGGVNFILTIWKARAPYVKWMDLDLFVWATLLTSILIVLATPVLTTALFMILFDRNFGTEFFDGSVGNPTMYQHIFWFYSHPAVYIMVLPAFGLVSGIISKFSRKEIFGYGGMVGSMIAITALSFMVWAHHMYTTGLDPFVRIAFTTMTFVIAIPSGIKVFNWITTLYGGELKMDIPLLFSLSFIIMFTFGGITGVYINIVSLDLFFQDTYWVVGHFHFVVAAGTLQIMFAAFYYYFPEMTGRMYHKASAQIHFWLWSIGNLVTFTAFTFLGLEGMPRRYFTYPDIGNFQVWHQIATIGAAMMAFSFIAFVFSMFYGYRYGEIANKEDPFELGSGYVFPKPFAQHVKEETGEDLHVEHKLSLWAPAAAFAFTLPLLAVAAFLEVGPWYPGTPSRDPGFLAEILTPMLWSIFLVGSFVLFLGLLFYYESNKPLDEVSLVDNYRKERNWEVWVFLASETIFFGALIGVGIAMRLNSDNWPKPSSVLDVNITAINTFILIISSFTMAKGLQSIGKGDQENLKKYLLATIGLGILFLSIQIYEYASLIEEGYVTLERSGEGVNSPSISPYPLFSSAFYLQTGFHGAHVLVGILLLTLVYLRARKGAYSKENHKYVEFVGLYWHFVDLVWIVLFTVVYLV